MDAKTNSMAFENLRVPAALLPALVSALGIARNTAMMCAEPRAKELFEDLRLQVLSLTPSMAAHFNDGKWTEVCAAAMDGAAWSVQEVREDYHWDTGRRKVEMRAADGPRALTRDEAARLVEGVRAYLESITPMS